MDTDNVVNRGLRKIDLHSDSAITAIRNIFSTK
jgi:hypothetical protein